MSEGEGIFPNQPGDCFSNKWNTRAHNASRAHNFFLRPNHPLDADTSWFNPMQRGRFEGFKKGEFTDDLKSLIFKPIIFFGLRLFEEFNVIYYFLATLFHLVTLSPLKAMDSAVSAVEAMVSTFVLDFYACLEVALQLGSFGMRSMLSVFEAVGFGSEVTEADEMQAQAFAV